MGKLKTPLSGRAGVRRAASACVLLTLLVTATRVVQAQQPAAASVATPPAPPEESASGPASPVSDDLYRIGPGDVLEVRVFNRPQLSREAIRVDGRGMISMPLIEDQIQAACRTEKELAKEIATRYLEYQRNPHVDVFVREYNSRPVALIGAVNKPGQFQLQRRVRLLELLAFAGGPREHAGRNVNIIHGEVTATCTSPAADIPDEGAAAGFVSYRLSDTLRGDDKANPFVQPGDIITLPDADQVFVVGNVLHPSAIPLTEQLTVSQVVAMAGGTLPNTQSNRVRIVRQTPGGKTEVFVDLKAIDKRRAEDVTLQANDIVDVPQPSGATKVLRDILKTIAPTATQLPMRVVW